MAAGTITTVEVEAPQGLTDEDERMIRVHAIQTGRNVGNETFARSGHKWSSNLRRRRPFEFPVFCYIVEHPEGLIAIDTGSTVRWQVSRLQHRLLSLPPIPLTGPEEEIGPQMRAHGLRPDDVRRVVLTHLDVDHAGGISYFPNAEILVHRPEYEFAVKWIGKPRFQPKLWPSWFDPILYDLNPEACGPFPESKALTDSGDVRLVPIPGHTVGQVGVVVETGSRFLFFSADHVLRQDWFVEDYAAGNLRGLAIFPRRAKETSRRMHRFANERPTVLLPAHDSEAPDRLAAMETLKFQGFSPASLPPSE